MNIIPDTLAGALTLSVFDFIMSFVVLGFFVWAISLLKRFS